MTGDIGGAFGSKTTVLREEVALCAAALRLGRSIKWIEDRNEHLVLGGQARDEQVAVEAAVINDGTVRGLRATLTMDAGAYPGFPYGAPMFCRFIQTMFPGPYRFDAMQFDTELVSSNKPTYVAYRGPWAVETFVRERLFDVIARELGITRAEIRLRNIFGPDKLPTTMVTGPTLDVRMSAKTTLEKALDVAEFEDWEEHQAAARAEGRRLGLGIATYIEAAPGPPGYLDGHARLLRVGRRRTDPRSPRRRRQRSRSTPGRCPMAKATRRPSRRWPPTSSAFPSRPSASVRRHALRAVRHLGHRRKPVGGDGGRGGRAGCAHAPRAIVDIAEDLFEARRRHRHRGRSHSRRGRPQMSLTFREVAEEAMRRGVVGNTDRLGRGEAIRVTGTGTAAKAAGRSPPTCAGSRSTSRPAR